MITIIRKYPTFLIGGDLIREVDYFPLIRVIWMFTSPVSQTGELGPQSRPLCLGICGGSSSFMSFIGPASLSFFFKPDI